MVKELWIARDGTGELNIFRLEPERKGSLFHANRKGNRIGRLMSDWYPEVTFENSPQKVEIRLKKDESERM